MRTMKIGSTTFDFSNHIAIMGILNVTPDSFSDGGRYLAVDDAVAHALEMIDAGAELIDIGGESTRPGSKPVTVEKELHRVIPVIKKIAQHTTHPLSIDTSKAQVAEEAIAAGASLINDITALRGDEHMADVVSNMGVALCLMHMQGIPETMQVKPAYQDILDEIKSFFQKQISFAKSQHISQDKIIIDPGIGFGKRTGHGIEDNCVILQHLSELAVFHCPILIGASRKSFLGNLGQTIGSLSASDRLEGSLAAATIAAMHGAHIIRAHDVKETKRCLDVVKCVLQKQ